MENAPFITRDNEILGGIPVFTGTRVPVKTLLDYLEKGHPMSEFLEDFPTVQREQAQEMFIWMKREFLGLTS